MFDTHTQGGIGQSISYRARLASELAKKLAEKLADQDEKDAQLQKRLLEQAPEAVREWLKDNIVLTNLFQYGHCSTKIIFSGDYGFGHFADIKTKMKRLSKAWKDIVLIKIAEPEREGVEIDFSAVM